MKLGKIAIVFILFFFLCSSDKIIIDDTRNYIAFHRNPEAGNIIDFDVWLININTKEETRITQNLEYWEYAPIWTSDSELLCLIEPQEKTMTETDIVYINFRTGKRKLLDFWTWRDDLGSDGVSADLRGNIYYADHGADLVYRISLKEKEHNAKEILSITSLKRLGLAEVVEAVISPDGTKLLLVASDSAKYERLTKARKFFYDDIYLYEFANNSLIKLISGDSTYEDPIWIGNDTIVFCSNCDGNYELYLMGLNAKNVICLTSTENISEMEPTVSPDHQQIAYMRYQGEYRFKDVEIWIMKEIEIIKIKPANLAFIVSAFYFFGGILTALVSLTLTLGSSRYYYGVSYIIRTLIYFLILFPVVGFILGFLFAFIYNLIAKYTGGIKVMIREDVDRATESS